MLVGSGVNDKRNCLLQSLDESIAMLASIRTPDSACTAAFDTLKQARALIANALASQTGTAHRGDESAEPVEARS